MKLLATVADFSQILKIFETGLLIAFIAVFALLVIGVIVGLFRGVFSSFFRLLMTISFVVVAFATIDPIVQFIGTFDLSGFFKYLVITKDGVSITVGVTNLFNTMSDGIAAGLILMGVNANPSTIVTLAISLTTAILKYAVLLIDLVLILSLGNLFIFLLWHLGVKRIVPKFAKKIAKVRWLSAISDGLRYVLVFFLMFSPLTAIVNSVNQAWQKYKPDTQNETVQVIGSFLDTYNNSLFAQVLFNWSYNEDTGLTFEGQILSDLTSATLEDGQISILSLLSGFTSVGGAALTLFEDSDAVNVANVFTTESLTGIFDAMNSINLIPYLLPLTFTIVVNSVELEGLDLNDVDLDEVDWVEELNTIETILIDIANTGIVDNFFNEDGSMKQVVEVTDLVKSMFTDNAYNYTLRVFESISKSEFLSEIISIVIAGLASQNEEMGKYLPCSYQEASAIDWGFELSVIYDNFFRLNKTDSSILEYLINATAKPQQASVLQAQEQNIDPLFDIILNNIDVLKKALIGNFDRDGNLMNCNEEGYTLPTTLGNYCLFDLNLFKGIFRPLIQTLIDSFASEAATAFYADVFEDTFNELFNGPVVKNFKEEFGAIFDCFEDITTSDVLMDMLLTNNFDDLINIEKDAVNDIADVIEGFGRSSVLTSVLKPILDETLKGADIADALNQIGLEPSDFNIMGCDDICKEMASIVRALPSINILTELTGGENILSDLGKYTEDIAVVLDTVFTSEILNPNFDKNKDNNFYSVLDKLFGMIEDQGIKGITFKRNEVNEALGNQKWQNTKTPFNDYPRDAQGNAIFDGEIGDLVNALKSLAKKSENASSPFYGKTLLEAVSNEGEMGDLVGRLESEFEISKIFASIEKCALLKVTFGEFLDEQLNPFKDIGIIDYEDGRSFTNVTNWEEEGLKFARICNFLGDMELDLNNFDFLAFDDFANLNRLLHSLADSSLFNDPNDVDGTTFNNFLFAKLKDTLASDDDGGYDLLCDEELTNGEKTFNKAAKDFEVRDLEGSDIIAFKENWCSSYWLDKYIDTNHDYDIDHEFYDEDYISQLCRLVKSLDEMKRATEQATGETYDNYVQALNSGKAPADSLHAALTYINEFEPMRMAIYHTFDIIVENISSSGAFDVSGANTKYLADYGVDKHARQFEIDNIFTVYEFYYEEILDKGEIEIATFIESPSTLLRLRDMLSNFAQSYIFHRSGPSEGKLTTAFQSLMKKVFEVEGLKDLLYSDNPLSKDQSDEYKLIYSNVDEKIDYMINEENFKYYFSPEYQIERINEIFEVISSFIGGPKDVASKEYTDDFEQPGMLYEGLGDSSLDFTSLDIKDISTNALRDIMINLNNSYILHECLPNALVKLLGTGHGNLIDDIMADADPYYAYYKNETTPDFENRYDVSEIDNLILIIDHFKAMNEYIPNGQVDTLLSLDDASFDLFVIEFEEMLGNLYSSNIFHQYKVSTRDSYTRLNFELSSFESLLNKVYIDTGLYRLIYSPEVDDAIYNPSGLMNEENAAKEKLISKIRLISKQDYIFLTTGIHNEVGMSDVWFDNDDDTNDEVHAFANLLKAAKALNIDNLTDINITVEGDNAKYFSPENIYNLFNKLNKVDAAEGAVARLVKELMTASGMADYSQYNGLDCADYYLTQKEYDAEGGVITIYDFLRSVAYYDTDDNFIAYNILNSNASDPMYQFVTGEWDEDNQIQKSNSSTVLLEFVTNSTIFHHKNIALTSIPTHYVHDDAIIFYNMFTPTSGSVGTISDYIFGNTKDEKIKTLDHIIHHIDYHPETDGNAIDVLLKNNFNSLDFNAGDFDSFNDFKDNIITALIALTHEDGDINKPRDRAFIASEIFAGIINDFVMNEVNENNTKHPYGSPYYIDPNYLLPRVKADGSPLSDTHDICLTTYDLLSVDEALGIEGILDLYNVGKNSYGEVKIENYFNLNETDLRNAFIKMEYQDIERNSRFASLIYISRLHEIFAPAFAFAENPFIGGYVPAPEYDVEISSSASLFDYGVAPNTYSFTSFGEYIIGAFNSIKNKWVSA